MPLASLAKIPCQTSEVHCHCAFVIKLVGRDRENLVVTASEPIPDFLIFPCCRRISVEVIAHTIKVDTHSIMESFRVGVDDVWGRCSERAPKGDLLAAFTFFKTSSHQQVKKLGFGLVYWDTHVNRR